MFLSGFDGEDELTNMIRWNTLPRGKKRGYLQRKKGAVAKHSYKARRVHHKRVHHPNNVWKGTDSKHLVCNCSCSPWLRPAKIKHYMIFDKKCIVHEQNEWRKGRGEHCNIHLAIQSECSDDDLWNRELYIIVDDCGARVSHDSTG